MLFYLIDKMSIVFATSKSENSILSKKLKLFIYTLIML